VKSARKHGLLLVFDEVITGFGRMGTAFRHSRNSTSSLTLLPMAKALTNGAIPMGGVAVTDEIYDTVTNAAPENAIEFFHGYTYSAHPAACAAGIAAQKIYESEGLFDRAAELEDYFLDAVWSLQDHPLVADIRGIGLMAGVELVSDGVAGHRGGPDAEKTCSGTACMSNSPVITRLLHQAFVAERKHVDEIVDKFRKSLDVALDAN
jgi:beta-alanine--pyruvate transaminase